jgi:hypothetical protein
LVTNFGSTCDRAPEELNRWPTEALQNHPAANHVRLEDVSQQDKRLSAAERSAPRPVTQARLWRVLEARRMAELAMQDADEMELAVTRDLENGAVVELGPLRFDRTLQEVRLTGT